MFVIITHMNSFKVTVKVFADQRFVKSVHELNWDLKKKLFRLLHYAICTRPRNVLEVLV